MSIIDTTTGAPYSSLAAAITGSGNGDVITLSAGTYVEDLPLITHSLTIQGAGGLATIAMPGGAFPSNGRAILSVAGNANANLTISHLELRGAFDQTGNGAAILFESGNNTLRVIDSWIHGNQEGVLTGGVTAASTSGTHIVVQRSELDHNGVPRSNSYYGLDHNLYVGDATDLVVQDSLFHDALGGHEIKSRAASNTITGNRIQDGPTATSSYSIDLPSGGTGIVSGNLIQKGPNADNRTAIHFGGEGAHYADSSLVVSGNTIIGARLNATTGVTMDAGSPVTITGNIFYGIRAGDVLTRRVDGPTIVADNTFRDLSAAPALDATPPYGTVPEPGTAALLPLALLGAAILRRGSFRRSRSGPSRSGC